MDDGKDPRNLILNAAERMLDRYGLAKFTIDSVAAESGMSKGGVLHYFATKRDMLHAVLDRFEERFFIRRDRLLESLPEGPMRLARATFTAIFETRKRMGSSAHYRIDMLEDTEFCDKTGRLKSRIFADITHECRRPEKTALAMYIMDGIWMNEAFMPNPIPGAYESKAKQALMRYIEELYGEYGDDPS